jgi:hypothetical protein
MGVEKQGIELGQARAAAGKGNEEEQCTQPAGNPNHASSLGPWVSHVHSKKLGAVH